MRHLSGFWGRFSLRTVLIVPFIVILTVTIGVTTYLSFRNGQQAINEVATQLRNEITARIEQSLQTYLETPYLVNELNDDALKLGLLNLDDLDSIEPYFWRLMHRFPTLGYVNLGLETGEYVGIERLDNGELLIVTTDRKNKTDLYYYATDATGNKTSITNVGHNFDSRTRPWYKAPIEANQSVWSEIYTFFAAPRMAIGAGQPAYDNTDKLVGVLSVDLVLSQIDEFLRQLKVGKSGRTFIMERSGLLIGASAGQAVIVENKEVKRVQAIENSDALISHTALFLQTYFGSLGEIKAAHNLEFEVEGERQFLQVTPLIDGRGIDWLIVVVIPEADFMAQINANTRQTLLLSLVALVVALAVGIASARSITEPLLGLNQSAKSLAQGNWYQEVAVAERQDEIGELAYSFKQMANQLGDIFQTLEQKVAERTEALQKANYELAKLNADKDKFFSIIAHDLKGPFMPLLGMAELLVEMANDLPPTEVGKIGLTIYQSGKRVMDLLENLLTWARMQMGRMEYAPEKFDLKLVVDNNIKLLKQTAINKNITIESKMLEAVWVYADKNMINTIIRNLINNALKFTAQGGQIMLSSQPLNERFIEVSVKDTGVGINPDDLPQLFKAEVLLTKKGTAGEVGTGLGLPMCKEMIELNGGEIQVESKLGQGTTFTFTVHNLADTNNN